MMWRCCSLLTCTTLALLAAADTELRLGPTEWIGGLQLANQHNEYGTTRVAEAVARPYFRGRFADVGIELDLVVALDDDDGWSQVDAGQLAQFSARVDYLVEFPTFLQVLPFIAHDSYVEFDGVDGDSATWLGADLWYLTPIEGLEVGGSSAVDLHGDQGWYLDLGLRQFLQYAPLDLRTWQTITLGSTDFHRFTSGADKSGVTTLQAGGEALLPLPWEGSWATMGAEVIGWLQEDDRRGLADDIEFVFTVGVQIRGP